METFARRYLVSALFLGCVFAAYAIGQTQVNYNLQVAKRPIFFRQDSAQVPPDGPVQYLGPSGTLWVRSWPSDGQIRPGGCNDPAALNLPAPLRLMGTPSMIATAAAVYFCIPDGTPSGSRLVRAPVAAQW